MKIPNISATNDRIGTYDISFSERSLKIFDRKLSTTDLDGAYTNGTLPNGYKAGDIIRIPGTKKYISNLIQDIVVSDGDNGTKCNYKANITCNNGYNDPDEFKLEEAKYSNLLMHDCFDYVSGVVNWKDSVISYAQDTMNVAATQISRQKRNAILAAIKEAIPTALEADGDSVHEQILNAIMKLQVNHITGDIIVLMKQSTVFELTKTTLKDVNGNLQIIGNDPNEMGRIYGAKVKVVPDSDLTVPFVAYSSKAVQYYEACAVQPSLRPILNSADIHDGVARLYFRRLYTVRVVSEETVDEIDQNNAIVRSTYKYFVKGTVVVNPLLKQGETTTKEQTTTK